MAGPSLRGFIPPDKLLSFRPRSALGIGGCAVIHGALILRPHPRPLAIDRFFMALVALRPGKIHRLFREDSAIDPASAGPRTVAGGRGRPPQLPPLAQVIPVDLPEHLLGIGLRPRSRDRDRHSPR